MPRRLTSDERDVLQRLRGQLDAHRSGNEELNRYANAKERAQARGVSEQLLTPLDWPRKVIDVLANKLIPEAPTVSADSELAQAVIDAYRQSNASWVEMQAIKSALRHGPAFVFTTKGDVELGEPQVVVSVCDAAHATALIDWRTRRVEAALQVLGEKMAILFTPGFAVEFDPSTQQVLDEYDSTERVPCAVYTNDPSLDHPFGRSRITPTVIGLTDAAARTLARQEVAAEFYQSPRPLFFGLSDEDLHDEQGVPVLQRAIGAGWGFPDAAMQDESDSQLRRAKVEWAPQATMQPFSDQFRLQAAALAAAASIPLQHLGVVQDSNPTSAEAIMAQEKPLVELAFAQQREFEVARRHLMLDIATTLVGGLSEQQAAEVRGLALRWRDPRHRSVSEQSQFVAMQVQAGNLPAGTIDTLRLLPIDEDDVAAIAATNALRPTSDPLAPLADILGRQGTQSPPQGGAVR